MSIAEQIAIKRLLYAIKKQIQYRHSRTYLITIYIACNMLQDIKLTPHRIAPPPVLIPSLRFEFRPGNSARDWPLKSLSGLQGRAIHNFLFRTTNNGLIELFICGKNK